MPSLSLTYDVLYTGEETDAGVGSGRRRWILDWYGFCFSIYWNVFEIALGDSLAFSEVQTVPSTFDVYYAYRTAHNFSHLNYIKTSCIQRSTSLSFERFVWVCVRLEVQTVRLDLFWILFFKLLNRRRMQTYQHIAFILLDRYIVRRTQKRRRRRFRAPAYIFRLIWFSLHLNVVKRVRNRNSQFVGFSVVQTVMKFERIARV
jgi:hypothetical protein